MLKALTILIFTSFFSAALLTPWVMDLIQIIDPGNRWPFSRVFGRVAQLAAAIMIYVYRREFELSALKQHFKGGRWLAKILAALAGLVITSASIALVIPLLVENQVLLWVESNEPLLKGLGTIFVSALVVSIIEESFFRLLMFSTLKKRLNVWFAAALTSLIYAAVHFIVPVRSFKMADGEPLSGFIYLGAVFDRFLQPELYPAFFGLFIVGMILCYVMHRSGSLFLCIGLHMGWAGGLKFVKTFTVLNEKTTVPDSLGGRYFLVAQPEAWLSMLAVLVVVILIIESGFFKRGLKTY